MALGFFFFHSQTLPFLTKQLIMCRNGAIDSGRNWLTRKQRSQFHGRQQVSHQLVVLPTDNIEENW